MKELNDLEICKRVAEIDNRNPVDVTITAIPSGVKSYHIEADFEGYDEPEKFDPLNNDELCFQLMIKYKVELNFSAKFFSQANVHDFESDDEEANLSSVDYWSDGCSHNKVICLAIIEANTKQDKAA